MSGLIDHTFSWPTGWQMFELVWLLAFAGYGYYLFKQKGWFKEPVTVGSMFWEVPLAGLFTAFLTTDFQLEGLFIMLKYHYVKEALHHDHVGRNLLIIGAVALILLIVIL